MTTATAIAIDVRRDVPDAYRALAALTRATPDIDHGLAEIVKVRVSQLNGCAYCVDLHSGLAQKAGISERALFSLPVWHDAPFFADHERAALRLAEALTLLPSGPVPTEAYAEAAEHFAGAALGQLVVAITAINAWNRVMLASGTQPAIDRN